MQLSQRACWPAATTPAPGHNCLALNSHKINFSELVHILARWGWHVSFSGCLQVHLYSCTGRISFYFFKKYRFLLCLYHLPHFYNNVFIQSSVNGRLDYFRFLSIFFSLGWPSTYHPPASASQLLKLQCVSPCLAFLGHQAQCCYNKGVRIS